MAFPMREVEVRGRFRHQLATDLCESARWPDSHWLKPDDGRSTTFYYLR